MNNIILFDGECNFCDRSVQFIIKRDSTAVFKFASLQSNAGKEIVKKLNIPSNIESVILVENNHYYIKSTAALRISKKFTGAWNLLYGLVIFPTPIRDYFYDLVARNRYKWFGKKKSCMLPSPEIRKRFL